MAKFSSSSFSSAMSSGIEMKGRASMLAVVEGAEASSARKRRNESGDRSLLLSGCNSAVLCELSMCTSGEVARSSWLREPLLSLPRLDDLLRKNRRQAVAGDVERDEEGESSDRGKELGLVLDPYGAGGGALGVMNLSSGFMVLKLALLKELKEALRFRNDSSVGTSSVLTVCPGRYGQFVVEGRFGSCVSKEPSSSY